MNVERSTEQEYQSREPLSEVQTEIVPNQGRIQTNNTRNQLAHERLREKQKSNKERKVDRSRDSNLQKQGRGTPRERDSSKLQRKTEFPR